MATKRVLIIDDEPGIRQIVQITLKAIAAWDTLTAASGQEGLKLAESEQPDAILLDVMMPGMDGITTFHHLREIPSIHHVPIILLTAKANLSEQQQLQELAIAGIITKPFKAPDLVNQMRSLLKWNS